ncbi:hypothetical protein BCR33DRAFT_763413 [Rhizoclosmatium globosum]|uniref:Uncharacterized protein n=1 Tax=Rhizoclosmatium globosum TaxID=329046 RepID=A0A1Y2CQ08_9FUNG|nr:hypothetical protein BCR33DRAFT_763413 [Rhizoclosmatium globosum]|eukprot:ORY48924.1 hypothetical protein BCR33DRAFT_763413 [Rhizoclosmatium globosum]
MSSETGRPVMDSALAIEEMFYPDDTVVPHDEKTETPARFSTGSNGPGANVYQTPNQVGKAAEAVGRLKGDMDGTARFIGRSFETPVLHMTGMLYLLSANAVEWIDSAEIAATYFKGIEDVIVGYWMSSGNITVDYIEQGKKFHDLADQIASRRRYDDELLFCIGVKTRTGSERLTTAQALETRLDSFYLAERKDWNETVAAAKNLVHETSTPNA